MENKKIILKYILAVSHGNFEYNFERAKNVTAEFEKEINKNCPEGYKYKETISFEKSKEYNWIKAIVAYEEIPR